MNKQIKVAEIEQLLKCNEEISKELHKQLAGDPRANVQKMYTKFLRNLEKEQKERDRVQQLYSIETRPEFSNMLIAGVDEVGRGPLAGPVYAAAVILPAGLYIKGLNDSKKVTAKLRKELACVIKQKSVAWSIAFSSVQEIDELNILKAAHLAMLRALDGLSILPDHALVDGASFPESKYQVTTIVDGDAKCACIAAASILAKVERDRVMNSLSDIFDVYGFDKNKGYGTKEHYQALQSFGPCPLHRKTFLKNVL